MLLLPLIASLVTNRPGLRVARPPTRAAVPVASIGDDVSIEFAHGVPELVVPTISWARQQNTAVATFTFANPMSYPEDLVDFGFGAEDLLLQIDLENVGSRELLEQLPSLHAVCAAAGVELRIYATPEDSRAEYATHVVTAAGEDAVDAQIIWDAAWFTCARSAAKDGRCPQALVVTGDHFGRVLASLGRPKSTFFSKSIWEPAPEMCVQSVTTTAELPLRWSGILRAETLSTLLTPRAGFSLDEVPITEGTGFMHLKDEEGTLVAPAFPTCGSSDENGRAFSVKSVLVANGLDEVERFFRFLHRYHDVCGADISPGPDFIAQLELCRQLEKHHSAKRMRDEEAASGAARRRGDAAARKPKQAKKPKKPRKPK